MYNEIVRLVWAKGQFQAEPYLDAFLDELFERKRNENLGSNHYSFKRMRISILNAFRAVRGFSAILVLVSSTISFMQVEAQTKRDRSKSSSQANKGNRSAEDIEFGKLLDIMIADMEVGWDTVVQISNSILKYNPSRVTWESADIVKVWIKEYLKRPFQENRKTIIRQRGEAGLKTIAYDSYAYSLRLFELNCSSSQLRTLSALDYNMKGNVLSSRSTPYDTFRAVVPDSVGEAIFSKFCVATVESKPEWKLGAFSEVMNCWYDASGTSRTASGTIRSWQKWASRADTTEGAKQIHDNISFLTRTVDSKRAEQYSYDIVLCEYNCDEGAMRLLRWQLYSRSAEMLYELPDVQKDWSRPVADGVAERMMRLLCSTTSKQ
ncbi:MAG: surface-adhesin E family protein [Pyrinomonadaceae bacterium]